MFTLITIISSGYKSSPLFLLNWEGKKKGFFFTMSSFLETLKLWGTLSFELLDHLVI